MKLSIDQLVAATLSSYLTKRGKDLYQFAEGTNLDPKRISSSPGQLTAESIAVLIENSKTMLSTQYPGDKLTSAFSDLDLFSPAQVNWITLFHSPRAFYSQLARNSQPRNSYTLDTCTTSYSKAIITSSLHDADHYSALDCDLRESVYRAIPTLWGLSEATVTHDHCIKKGDQHCTYTISWDQNELPTSLQRIASSVEEWLVGNRRTIKRLKEENAHLRNRNYLMEEQLQEEERLKQQMDVSREAEAKARQESERKSGIFRRYVRHSLVDSVDKGENPLLYPSQKISTAILFSDIRGFTKISEELPDYEVTTFLNDYLQRMTSVIHELGEIDKYMGDSVMANFEDVDDAICAAINMKSELQTFNQEAFSGEQPRPLVSNGIGLHYGQVIIGNIGSEKSRFDYTLIGDAVNIASRLEGLTKQYNVGILLSESAADQVEREQYHIRELDLVRVKGKTKPLKVFEVYDHEPEHIRLIKRQTYPYLRKAFESYKAGDVERAQKIYTHLKDQLPQHNQYKDTCIDPVIDFLHKRSAFILSHGIHTEPGWEGVYDFKEK